MSLRPNCNGYAHICDHAGLVCDTVVIARLWLVTGILPIPFSEAAILNFGSRPTSDNVDSVISDNMEVEVGIAAPSLTVQKL